jgi:hypothetical protein
MAERLQHQGTGCARQKLPRHVKQRLLLRTPETLDLDLKTSIPRPASSRNAWAPGSGCLAGG